MRDLHKRFKAPRHRKPQNDPPRWTRYLVKEPILNGDGMSVYTNERGFRVVNHRIIPIGTGEGRGMSFDEPLPPNLETALREVIHEVESLRLSHKLMPFVERTPIGALPRRVRPKRATDAEVRRYRNRKHEDDRAEMLALRRINDQQMEEILNS